MRIRKTTAPDDHRPEEKLVEEDWDDLLYYYSRCDFEKFRRKM